MLNVLRNGKYKPKPVKRVEIPKPDGGKRNFEVPTLIDRMIQQPIYEPLFSDNNYGFRPNRSAHQAINKALEYYNKGYT